MKKQNSLYRMTTSEMQIMTYLWNSKEPAIASQIVSDLIPTQNCTWKPRSVFTILKSLSEKDLIHDVIERADQKGEDAGDGELQHQFRDLLLSQIVCLLFRPHGLTSVYLVSWSLYQRKAA